jgi:hypothetical protein
LRKAVYTCVVDGYDRILAPAPGADEPGIDYVAFSDRPEASVPAPWQSRSIVRRERNPRMTARWHKLHPHLLFPDHDLSLYVDSNILLRAPFLGPTEGMLAAAPIALFRHPERDCPYEEAAVVKRHRLDEGAVVEAQMAYYRSKGLPAGAGLHYSGVLFRRHRDAGLVRFLEDWWRQLKVFSHRDQLSLDFMLRSHSIAAADIPGRPDGSRWFAIAPHRRYRVHSPDIQAPSGGDELDWLRMALIAEARRQPSRPSLPAALEALHWHLKRPLRAAKRLYLQMTWRPPAAAARDPSAQGGY